MKKIVSLAASLLLAVSAVPFAASAVTGEEIAEMIKNGECDVDFNNDGYFDCVDARVVLAYYGDFVTSGGNVEDWSGKKIEIHVESINDSFLKRYDAEIFNNGGDCFIYEVDNDMLEKVKQYGDVTADGVIDSKDSAMLLDVYENYFKVGDVNSDGYINATDSSYVLSYYSAAATGESSYLPDYMMSICDVNGDRVVDPKDASAILSLYSSYAVS